MSDYEPDWRDRAACLGVPTSAMFPFVDDWRHARDEAGYAPALAVCAGCPVTFSCAVDAFAAESRNVYYGARGGLVPAERRRLMGRRLTPIEAAEKALVGSAHDRGAGRGDGGRDVVLRHCDPPAGVGRAVVADDDAVLAVVFASRSWRGVRDVS